MRSRNQATSTSSPAGQSAGRSRTRRGAPSAARGGVPVSARAPKPDSPRRAPMARPVERTEKRAGDVRGPADIPAFIRAPGVPAGAPERVYLRRKLGRKLGKFAGGIERVSVRLEDSNGPRGGVDQVCRIKVTLRGLPAVLVEAHAATVRAAMDGALARVEQAVKHPLQRRRGKPLQAQRRSRQAERIE